MHRVIPRALLMLLLQAQPAVASHHICAEIAGELQSAVHAEVLTEVEAAKIEDKCWRRYATAKSPR